VRSVPKMRIDNAVGLTVADVLHEKFTALPASATIADVRDWFAASSSRRMAVLADDGRYVGSLTPAHVAGEDDPERVAAEVAQHSPTVAPEASATRGQELALSTDARRVPVVDHDGRVLGIVSVTGDLTSFCGTG
jgi:CBS domain-containing protein